LKRMDNTQPWGFRLKGGVDQGLPLHIEHVQPKGRAAGAGLALGDLIVGISGLPTQNMTHTDVKNEMLRAGNELSLTIQRDGSLITPTAAPPAASAEPRSVVVEEPLAKLGGTTFKRVTPKTYQVLAETLPAGEGEGEASGGGRPASIFDRKREERSEYLKAKGQTIQKAYGEQN